MTSANPRVFADNWRCIGARALDHRTLFLHGLAISAPIFLFIFDFEPWWTLGIGGICVTICYLCLGYSESRRQRFWLSPLSFFFFWYSIGYGLSAIYAAFQAHEAGYLYLISKEIPAHDLAEGYTLSLLGAFCLHLGYISARSFSRKNGENETPPHGDFKWWILAFIVGLASLVRPGYFGSIGVARAILQLAPIGVLISFGSLPAEFFRMKNSLYVFYFIAGNTASIACTFYGGSKYLSMLALLPLLSAAIVRPRWRKTLPFLMALGIALYLFLLAPVIMNSRSIQGVDSRIQKLEISAQDAIFGIREDALYEFETEGAQLLYRQFESTAVGFIVGDVRDHGLQYGTTMTNFAYAFIPRLVWPEKPMVTRGDWFTAYLGGSGSEEESTTSTGMYSAGELYWNFGVPGVVIGMFVMGWMFGFLVHSRTGDIQTSIVPIIISVNLLARIVEQAAASEIYVLLIYFVLLTNLYRYLEPMIGSKPSLSRLTHAQRLRRL